MISYVVLTYALTWTVWFAIPLFSDNWGLSKVLMGAMIAPGLVAVVLDRLRNGSNEEGGGALVFAGVFASVLALNLWCLSTPDAMDLPELGEAVAPGLSVVGVVGALASSFVSAFVARAAWSSRKRELSTIFAWPRPVWMLVALFLPATVDALGLVLTFVSGTDMPPSPLAAAPIGVWLPYVLRSAAFTFFVVAINEEPGWRGFLLPELLRRHSPLVASLIVGVVWGLWHAPLHIIGFYGGGAEGILGHTAMMIPFAVVYTWLYLRGGGNLLAMLVLHTSMNNTPRLVPGPDESALVFVVVVVAMVISGRMWKFRSQP